MIQYLNVFFYDIYPYICATIFFLGSWLRYDYGQYTWRASSSQMLDKRGMVIWSNLFHIGILGIFFWPSVWNADATLDVCLVPADCG
ncbi:respiratory nitrate reductase 2 subunit gamma [Salmonella enterica subsp. enterica]|uniref:Respiratory nitrate reductase 2 subunit gamma n=1 Tax=Salmonella enterica I TaxID=59201 RepID=A0A447U307_SALET|nr:respiratory nitrate reductase 2 subunit gamma [Salmonella enterica subsp. enterica]